MKKSLIAAILLLLLLLILYWQFPYALKSSDSKANLIYFVALVAGGIIGVSSSKYKSEAMFRDVMIWLSVAIVLLLSYSYKDELLSLLVPNRPRMHNDSLVIMLSNDGHFHIEVMMNGKVLDCMVDTGATSIVVDTEDAMSIGVDIDGLSFNVPSETANGTNYSARARVSSLRIGDIELEDKLIMVNKTKMNSCLLGMSFLSTLKKISIEGDKMIMSPM
jgi:aspartyl protease family protein